MKLIAHHKFTKIISWFSILVMWVGCAWHPLAKVTATLKGKSGQVIHTTGETAGPGYVSTNEHRVEIPVWSGAVITIDTTNLKLGSGKTAPVVITTRSETIQSPTNFTPPAPPSQTEMADGRIRIYFWIGFVVGLIAGLAGLFYSYPMVSIGGACVAVGCTLGLVVKSNPWIFGLIALGIVLKIAGPTLWHLVLKNRPVTPPSTP